MKTKINHIFNKQYSILLFILISLIISLCVLMFTNCIYGVIDDLTISMIASGVFGDEYSHCLIYGNAVLGWIIRLLNKLYQANYFMILQYVLLLISVSLFSSIIVSKTHNIKLGIVTLIGLWLLFFIDLFVHITYTTTAGYISLIGLLGVITFNDKSKTLSIISLVLSLFGFMYRYQAFLLIAPFVMMYFLLSKRKEIFNFKKMKHLLIYFSILIIGVAICVGVNKYTYRSNEWKKYFETNNLRTKLQDYQTVLVSADENITWSKNDFDMFYQMKNDNPIVFGYDNLLKVVNASKRVTKSFNKILDGIKDFYINTFPYYQIIALFVLYVWSILNGKDVIVKSLLISLTGVIIMGYLLYQGRYPVAVSSIVLISIVLPTFLFIIEKNIKCNSRIMAIIVFVLLLLLPIKFLKNRKISSNREFSLIEEIKKDKSHIYVLDSYTFSDFLYNYRPYNKISNDLMENFVIIGGWISPSPLTKSLCSKNGADNALDILGKRDDVFYATLENSDISIVERYLQEHYDRNIKKELVQNIGGGYVIYKFNSTNKD